MIDIEIRHGDWAALKDLAAPIRYAVFVEEQHVPVGEEWDGRDDACVHFLATSAGTPVGTARLLPDGHIGRMAVLSEWRGQGLGRRILDRVIAVARARGNRELLLAAQLHAIPFYERLGFEAFGDEFQDAGIPHRMMRRLETA